MKDDVVTDLEAYVEEYYKLNPFSDRWPWAIRTQKHLSKIAKDNEWYQMQIGVLVKKDIFEDLESAPF